MPKMKTLMLCTLALGLWAVGVQAEPAAEPAPAANVAVVEAEASETTTDLSVDENCPVHGVHAKPAANLTFEATPETALMSTDEIRDEPPVEGYCYITGSNCESCGAGKIRACTFKRCYCSCSGTWYNTKSCIPCGNFC